MKKFRGIFSGARGQRRFNILYNLGASVVILGALFKLLHWNYADTMLIVGMGTEALIFFLSAFDNEPVPEEAESPDYSPLGASSGDGRFQTFGQTEVPVHQPSLDTAATAKQLQELNDAISKLQASMPDNLDGLNDMQKEAEQMTATIKELNKIYDRMLAAMQSK